MKRQKSARHPGIGTSLLVGFILVGLPAVQFAGEPLARSASGPRPHETASCTLCHFSVGVSARLAGSVRVGKCLSCHAGDEKPGNETLGFHEKRDQDCSGCHSFHALDEIRVLGGRLSLDALKEAGTGHCRSCHGAGGRLADLSDAHRVAADLYHGDLSSLRGLSPSQGCLQCHGADSRSSWQENCSQAVGTLKLHNTHPLGIPNRATRPVNAYLVRNPPDRRLSLYEGRIECQTCHQITTRTPDLVVTISENQDLCLGCHQRNEKDRIPLSILAAAMAPEVR